MEKLTITEYKTMIEYCRSPQQIELVTFLAQGHSVSDASREFDRAPTHIYRSLRAIRKRMTNAGVGSHFVAKKKTPDGLITKGTSTLYDEEGNIKLQWHKTDKEASDRLAAISEAIEQISDNITPVKKKPEPTGSLNHDLLNVYISNDLHFGAYMWAEETLDKDYNLDIAREQLDSAITYLVKHSPKTRTAIVADLGDTTEMDDFKNATPGHGHNLDVDSRYSKVIKVAMEAMVNLVSRALEHHQTVHFINIGGNHDPVTSHAIRAFVAAWFRNEPRVIVDESPAPQKYFLHGTTLLGFAHGDGLRMHDAGETMAMHNGERWNQTKNRYYHFGHNHKDKIVDGRLCKAESHRNIAPLNAWASHAGFGRQIGTMKSITYCKRNGEKSRNLFNVDMMEEDK